MLWLAVTVAGLSVTLSCGGCLWRASPVRPDYLGRLLRHPEATNVALTFPSWFREATDIAIEAEYEIEKANQR